MESAISVRTAFSADELRRLAAATKHAGTRKAEPFAPEGGRREAEHGPGFRPMLPTAAPVR